MIPCNGFRFSAFPGYQLPLYSPRASSFALAVLAASV